MPALPTETLCRIAYDTNALKLTPMSTGALAISESVVLRRGLAVEVCGEVDRRGTKVRHKNEFFLISGRALSLGQDELFSYSDQ
jgi:hypothetical protein